MLFAFLALFSLCCTTTTMGEEPATPALPDGGLLFSGKRDNQWDLYVWQPRPSGDAVYALTHTSQAEGNPVYWSRHNLFLCSTAREDGRFVLAAYTKNGSEAWSIELPDASLGWPQPSPWDDRILAVREDPQTGMTAPGIVNYPDGGFEPFPEADFPGGQPIWVNPDQVLISRVRGQEFDLCLRRLSTGAEETLVSGGKNWLSAASPVGGEPFFFTRRVGQASSIFRLTQGAADRPLFHDNAKKDTHSQGTTGLTSISMLSDRFSASPVFETNPSFVAGWSYDDFTASRLYDWQPSVTPDGCGLIYLSLREGHFRVVYRSLQAPGERIISLPGFEQVFHPTWIPVSGLSVPGLSVPEK
ncbi:MAG: hypothetical protein WA705_25185 [Candidatus Ozemobacteraceae bacterium]